MKRRLPPMNDHDTPKENTNGLLQLFVLCCALHKTNNVVTRVMLSSSVSHFLCMLQILPLETGHLEKPFYYNKLQ